MIRVTLSHDNYQILFQLLDLALKANGISSLDVIYNINQELKTSAENIVKEDTKQPSDEVTSNG